MIKLVSTKEGITRMEVSGSTLDIAFEVTNIIRAIYGSMAEHDEENANVFKRLVESGMEIAFVPDDELEGILQKEEKRFEKNMSVTEKTINDTLKALEELKESLSKAEKKCDGEA